VLILAIRRAVVVADRHVKTDFISRLRDHLFETRERVTANQIVTGFCAMEVRLRIGNEQRFGQRGAAALLFCRQRHEPCDQFLLVAIRHLTSGSVYTREGQYSQNIEKEFKKKDFCITK